MLGKSSSPPTTSAAPKKQGGRIRVWDLPTRLFHWILVILFVVMMISGNKGHLDIHIPAGCALLALLVYRLLWGLFGSQTARFSDFIKTPKTIICYVFCLFSSHKNTDRPRIYLGHNPLGGMSVVALLSVLFAQVVTGLFARDNLGITNAPFTHLVSGATASWMTYVHKNITLLALIILVAVHLCAILFYLFAKRENLVHPMITGYKKIDTDQSSTPVLYFRSSLLALAALAISAAGVWLILIYI